MPEEFETVPLEVRGLVKDYPGQRALDGVDLEVRAGEVVALLGPNGAGKTTLIRTVLGLVKPSAGSVRVFGADPFKQHDFVHSRLGWVGQDTTLYDELNAREHLWLAGKLHGISGKELGQRIENLLALAGLTDRARDRVKTYSGGMRRRLFLAVALMHRPRLLLLDEPMTGVDAHARAHIASQIQNLASAGAGVLISTHNMEVAEKLADRVVILDRGKVIAKGTVEELKSQLGSIDLVVLEGEFREPLEMPADWKLLKADEERLVLGVPNGREAVPRMLELFREVGQRVDAVVVKPPNLETLFLELTGRELRQ